MSNEDDSPKTLEQAVAETSTRLQDLEEKIKERETSFFRAVKTFVIDIHAFASGSRRNFPMAATLGLCFAYLRPRAVLVLGSIGAVVIATTQVVLLVQQNRILDQQSAYLRAQTDSAKLQAVAVLLASIDPEEPARTSIAISQLADYGSAAVPALLRLGSSTLPSDSLMAIVLEALFEQVEIHSPEQFAEVISLLANAMRSPDFPFPQDEGRTTAAARYLEAVRLRASRDQQFGLELLRGRDAPAFASETFIELYQAPLPALPSLAGELLNLEIAKLLHFLHGNGDVELGDSRIPLLKDVRSAATDQREFEALWAERLAAP